MSVVKAKAQPRRTKDQEARKMDARVWAAADAHELQKLKDSIAAAAKLLCAVVDDLNKIGSFTYTCIEALRAQPGDDVGPEVAVVLDAAYETLVSYAGHNAKEALKVLKGGGQ